MISHFEQPIKVVAIPGLVTSFALENNIQFLVMKFIFVIDEG
jgi:hypothetical protein